MENNDLRAIWHESHAGMKELSEGAIKKIIHKKHSRIISRILNRQRKKIFLFISLFVFALFATVVDWVIMETCSILLLSVTVFWMFKMLSGIMKFRFLFKSVDMYSIKESTFRLKKELSYVKRFDFIIGLFFFYGMDIYLVLRFVKDLNAFSELTCFIFVFIMILFLIIPWIVRYYNKQQYKYYLASLDRSLIYLEREDKM